MGVIEISAANLNAPPAICSRCGNMAPDMRMVTYNQLTAPMCLSCCRHLAGSRDRGCWAHQWRAESDRWRAPSGDENRETCWICSTSRDVTTSRDLYLSCGSCRRDISAPDARYTIAYDLADISATPALARYCLRCRQETRQAIRERQQEADQEAQRTAQMNAAAEALLAYAAMLPEDEPDPSRARWPKNIYSPSLAFVARPLLEIDASAAPAALDPAGSPAYWTADMRVTMTDALGRQEDVAAGDIWPALREQAPKPRPKRSKSAPKAPKATPKRGAARATPRTPNPKQSKSAPTRPQKTTEAPEGP